MNKDNTIELNHVIYKDKIKLFLDKMLTSINLKEFEEHKLTFLYFILGIYKTINIYDMSISDRIINLILDCAVVKDKKLIGFIGYKDYKTLYLTHIAATYSAICCLHMLNLPLLSEGFKEKLEKNSGISDISVSATDIICEINGYFDKNTGCFSSMSIEISSDQDVRFIYCAYAIREFLILESLYSRRNIGIDHKSIYENIYLSKNPEIYNQYIETKRSSPFSNIADISKIEAYLESISTYEGGFSIFPKGESNAGTTFCAISSYFLSGIEMKIDKKKRLLKWLYNRYHEDGNNGRTNKQTDTCYSFWVTGSLKILGLLDNRDYINENIDYKSINEFIFKCQKTGFVKNLKVSEKRPDILHSFYSISALSLLGTGEILEINPLLVIPLSNLN